MKISMIDIKLRAFYALQPLLRLVGSIFFEEKYLRGKCFDNDIIGWKWLLRSIIWQKIFGFNRHIPWPVSPFIIINDPRNINFDVDDINNFQTFGNYFQNFIGTIYIGKNSLIGPNVGLITANHDPDNLKTWVIKGDIILGENCWIGMNSMILPGVRLGDHTVVGAGSVVTKSFPEGNVLIAGNPAAIIRYLTPQESSPVEVSLSKPSVKRDRILTKDSPLCTNSAGDHSNQRI